MDFAINGSIEEASVLVDQRRGMLIVEFPTGLFNILV